MKLSQVLLFLLMGLAGCSSFPKTDAQTSESKTRKAAECWVFTQQFYDWYLALAKKDLGLHETTWKKAAREKPQNFGPDLLQRLEEHYQAQQKNHDEIVGIDWEPILDAQDFPEKYRVSKTRIDGDFCYATMEEPSWKKKSTWDTALIAQLMKSENGDWRITNIHSPNGGPDLLTALANLKKSREESP